MPCIAFTNPGDEVLVTDPTYAGMVNRVRLVGAEPRFVPLSPATGRWRIGCPGPQRRRYRAHPRRIPQQPIVSERLGRQLR